MATIHPTTYYYSNPTIGANFTTLPGALSVDFSKPVASYELNGKRFVVMREVKTVAHASVVRGTTSAYVTKHYYNRHYSTASVGEQVVFDTHNYKDLTADLQLFIVPMAELNSFVVYSTR